MKYKSLRTQILSIIITLTLILLIVVNVYNYQDRKKILYNISIEKLLILTKMMRNFEKKQLKFYKGRIDTVQANNRIIALIKRKDTKNLQKDVAKLFVLFKKATPNLEHIHIITPDGEYLYLDNIQEKNILKIQNNKVLQEVIRSKKLQTGYVIFHPDNYFYSITAPIKQKDKIIAYIEFGIKADNIFKIASRAGRYKYALYLNNTQESTTQPRAIGSLVTANYNMFENLHIDQDFIYTYANKNKVFSYGDKDYLFHQYDIEKSFQKNFAQVLMASNVTKYSEDNKKQTIITFIISLVILSFIYLSIYIVVTKLINKLEEDEKELSNQQKQMQVIIDNNNSLITLFKEDDLILANKPFLSFFNFKSLETFKEKYPSIDELFHHAEETFVSKENEGNLSWITQLKSLKTKEKVIAFEHQTYGVNYFNVQISPVPNQKNSFVVVFSNITTIFKQSQKDQYMARHDPLTGIYNRQFFNEAITRDLLQQVSHAHNSALLMFDLDFFKKVNDTYGHQVGDAVLINFAKTITKDIRANDIFARWGGEEFVLLLTNISEETALSIANNLRKKIETTDFNEVKNITCSIGLSTYIINDSVESWFTRVDEALYKAKANGRNRVEAL